MDSFMDKLAHRLGSQDVIKANAAAEAADLNEKKERLAEYENCLSQMRQLNLKNAELSEQISQLVASGIEKIEECQTGGQTGNLSEELKTLSGKIDAQMAKSDELFKQQEDLIHKENVRVYRNVQAAIVDELKLQTEALAIQNNRLEKKMSGIKPMSIIALVFSSLTLIGIAVNIILGYLV